MSSRCTRCVRVSEVTDADDFIINQLGISDLNSVKELMINSRFKFALSTFIAYNCSNEPIGTVCCQIAAGPIPQITKKLLMGTIWGLTGSYGTSLKLVRAAIGKLKTVGVNKIVVNPHINSQDEIYQALNFTHSNARIYDMEKFDPSNFSEIPGITFKRVGAEADSIIMDHWYRMWIDNGTTEFLPEAEQLTYDFIADARKNLKYQTLAAFDGDAIVGSACIQIYTGMGPVSLFPSSGAIPCTLR